MKISVAMTTYKSTKYIKEQLESIFNQSYLPDEIIICDDASPDDTVFVTNEIIKNAPKQIDIKLYVNDTNLGFVKNFEKAFSKCSGEIIFPCDADDIWEKEKIITVVKEFKKDNEIVYAFHDAIVIDAEGNIISESLNAGWDTRTEKDDKNELIRLTIQRKGVAYGFTSAIRKSVIDACMPFPKGYGHDEWLGICVPLYGNVISIPAKLARYRRHGNNTSGNRPSIRKRMMEWNLETWFTHPEEIRIVYEEYLNRYRNLIPQKIRDELYNQIEFQKHLENIVDKECWGGLRLIYYYYKGIYQKYRRTRNTLILDEVYLMVHFFERR